MYGTSIFSLALALSLWPGAAIAQMDNAITSAAPEWHDGWDVIEPGGETGCAFGTPFRFFYREGPDPSKLMVYFQGGGACWNWVSCSGMFDSSVTEDELAGFAGIFDFDNPDNPFGEYSIVFVPYCTGDVHVGDTIGHYGDASWDARPVEHRGHANVTAALEWAGEHLPQPKRLVVTGASAGSYGALFQAPGVAVVFPSAELTVIGDSGVPLLYRYPHILERWGAARILRRLWYPDGRSAGATVTLLAAHEYLAHTHPRARIVQITTDRDAVQSAFYLFSGSPDWREATLALLKSLDKRIPTFHAYVLMGRQHGLMRTDRFYSFEENGVRLRDWIADLVDGDPVTSQYCRECDS